MSKHQKVDTKMLNPQKIKMSRSAAITYLTVGAFVGAFSSYFFVLAANLYSPGLAGFSSGISYTFNDILWATGNVWGASRTAADSMIYWVVYIACNIPIIYMSTRWFSNRFLYYSLYYFVVNFAFSMVFANVPSIAGGIVDMEDMNESVRTVTVLFFSFIGGMSSGSAVGLAFKVGASTMGLDPVAKHISRERNMNIGPVISSITAVTTLTFILIRAFIPQEVLVNEITGETVMMTKVSELGFLKATLFSPEYIGSWLFIISYSVVADTVYSSAKKVEVLATTEHADEISDYLNNSAYHRGHSIVRVEGGYSHTEKKAIMMIIGYDEMFDIVEKIAAMDAKAFITVKELFKIYDIHNWTPMTDEDKEKERMRIIKQEKKTHKLEARLNKKKKD